MSPTLPSALTLSLLGLSTKAFLRLACKDFEVRGLDRLVGALREPGEEVKRWKGKEKEVCTPSELDGVLERFPNGKRRGIVTGEFRSYSIRGHNDEYGGSLMLEWLVVCNHTSVVDDPMVRPFSLSFGTLLFAQPATDSTLLNRCGE
jgi:monolysocardiolipin acyltransferase